MKTKIINKTLRFSETGAAFFADFMSKHAMHADASEELYFAGEFRFLIFNFYFYSLLFDDDADVQHRDDKYVFVIDNNSGTYAPPQANLQNLKKLFNLAFPDLEVEVIHWEDPLLKQYKLEIEQTRVNIRHTYYF